MEDFYELELNIKDLKTLDESLDQYLSTEDLQGENQYYCESCHARVDATRCIKLRSLPTVLNLQLKRYVFLPKVVPVHFYMYLLFIPVVKRNLILFTISVASPNAPSDEVDIYFPVVS